MKSKIAYLSYNDAPSGIYSSQVIDVVKFIQSNFEVDISLVAFVSLRNYFENRRKIKNEFASAIVLPMFPKIKNWAKNIFLLSLICKHYAIDKIIGRSVLATQLALILRDKKIVSKVIYDGRGAIVAEWKEYNVVNDPLLVQNIEKWEKEVVLNSDYRIAVSNKLVDYWKENFNYTQTEHVIIPCTINKTFEHINFNTENIKNARKELNFTADDIVFIYSGSLAGWQSFNYLKEFFQKILGASANNKVLFLSDKDNHITNLQSLFPKQVFNEKAAPQEVPNVLIAGDYGILLRGQSITNKVASPVKFAEYIACGLQVIISDNLGDYSELVRKYNFLGFVYEADFVAKTVSISEKEKIENCALDLFSKVKFKESYEKIVMC